MNFIEESLACPGIHNYSAYHGCQIDATSPTRLDWRTSLRLRDDAHLFFPLKFHAFMKVWLERVRQTDRSAVFINIMDAGNQEIIAQTCPH